MGALGWRAVCALVWCILALATLAGCTTFGYLTQAGLGQLDIVARARSLDSVVRDERTPERTRYLLEQVPAIKRFGERQGLSPTHNYTTWVELDRPAAVWVVSASERLQFHTKSWVFPIIGSITYLGWFALDDAEDFARELFEEGWDVDVRRANAYSTLGWFRDPVLSTMLPEGAEALGELADAVLHESLHATLYVDGQSLFNEGVAQFVGQRLAAAYLDERGAASAEEKASYLAVIRATRERQRVMLAARDRLEQVYSSAAPERQKLAEKAEILVRLREDIRFGRPITNATLAQLETYAAGDEELDALLRACGGSFPRLIATLRRVGPRSFQTPQQRAIGAVLLPLVRAGCPASTARR